MGSSADAPRIALLLSGLPRQWKPSLQTQLDLLQNYPFDVFFHFWDTIGADEKAEIVGLLKPRAYRFETPQDLSAFDRDPAITPDRINIPSRIMSQFYSWKAVAELAAPFQSDYAVGLRSRADLQFVYSFDHIIPKLQPNDLVATWWDEGVLADLCAIGGIEPILYYHRLYDRALDYAAGMEFSPENLLARHLRQRPDIKIYGESTPYFFVRRPHMENYTVEQAMLENPGRNKWLDPETVAAHEGYHRGRQGSQGLAHLQAYRAGQLSELTAEVARKKISTGTG